MPGTTQDDLRSDFKAVMRRYPAAVTIVTSTDDKRRHGMTATAVTSLSLDPPSLLVCINRSTLLHDIMLSARHFCVNLLSRDQSDLSSAFSGALPPESRFELGSWGRTDLGVDFLESAQANVFCHRTAAFPYATHTIFIGEVEGIKLSGPVEPLIYHDATYCTSLPAAAAVAQRA